MLVPDPITGEMVDDGRVLNTPGSTPLFQPDEVSPSDLVTTPVPLTVESGLEAARRFGTDPGTRLLASAGGAALSGLGGGAHEQLFGAKPGQPDRRDPTAPTGAPPTVTPEQPPGELPSQPVTMPAPKPAKSHGGGGGSAIPTGPTAGQTMAHGQMLSALDEERGILQSKGEIDQRKVQAEIDQDAAEKAQYAALQKQQAAEQAALQSKLQAAEDTFAKDKIHDQFDGKPLAAIVAALSSGLGAFAASMSGGENHAQGVLDRSAQMFRQKELQRLEQEKDSITGARMSIEHAEARADAATAGFWRQMARDREAILRAKVGPDEARIANDALIQNANARAAEMNVNWNDKAANIARQSVLDKAQVAQAYASANHSNAEAEKTRAEAAALAMGGGKEAGRGITDARQRAMIVTGLADQERIVQQLENSGVHLTEKDLQTIQDNRTYLEAAKHGDTNTMNALGTVLKRRIGLVPRNELDGLDEKKKKLAGAQMLMTQKAAMLAAGSQTQEAIKHASDIVDLLAPGLGPQERARRREYIRTDLIGANQGLVPGQVAAARGGAEGARAPAAMKPTPGELARVIEARKAARSGSPEWVKLTEVAKRMQAEMGQ